MLADDHPLVRMAFQRMVDSSCEVVGTVSNGHDAVHTAVSLRPDALVVDLMMGDLNGLEVCRRVKEAAPETNVIIVTAFDDAQVEIAALQAGAAAFMPKHSAVGTLAATIQRLCSDNRSVRL